MSTRQAFHTQDAETYLPCGTAFWDAFRASAAAALVANGYTSTGTAPANAGVIEVEAYANKQIIVYSQLLPTTYAQGEFTYTLFGRMVTVNGYPHFDLAIFETGHSTVCLYDDESGFFWVQPFAFRSPFE